MGGWCWGYTVKSPFITRAFIRIITFHGERGGHLLEARVLTKLITSEQPKQCVYIRGWYFAQNCQKKNRHFERPNQGWAASESGVGSY